MNDASFVELLDTIVDNRGRTAPTASAGIPLIATNCIKDDHLYPVKQKVRFVDEATYDTWFRGHPEPGDILFVCKGSPGRTALVTDPVDFVIAQDMVAVRADPSKVYPKFLFAALRSPGVRQQIDNMHVGTLIPHFKKGDFGRLRIPLPDRKTQVAIGNFYFEFSEKIESNRRVSQKLLSLADALYSAALFRGRRPVKVEDVTDFHNRRRVPLSSRERSERAGRIPYYGATGVLGSVDEALFNEVLILVGEDGSVIRDDGGPVLQYIWGPAWINNHAHPLTGRGISNEALFIALNRADIRPIVTGAVQAKVNMRNLKSLVVEVPTDISELESDLSALFALYRSKQDEIVQLAAVRNALLPELLSGRVRVPAEGAAL